MSIISRLAKEGHQVFIITGSLEKDRRKTKDVFQEYRFPFNSNRLDYIIKNINPDIAVIHSRKGRPSDDIAAITNIMLALEEAQIKKLLYLSSLSVFSGTEEKVITEASEAKPQTDQEKTIHLEERICLEYSKASDYQVNILRFSEIYGYYHNDYLADNILAEICEKIVEKEEMEVFTQKKHSLIYMDDAVDALYKVMMKTQRGKENIYHVAPEPYLAFPELEIIQLLSKQLPEGLEMNYQENNQIIENKEYKTKKIRRLSFKEKYKVKDKIKDLYRIVKKRKDESEFQSSEKESLLARIFKIEGAVWDKLFPYIENFAFFILFTLVIYFSRSFTFHQAVDSYLLYIVIIALIYGFEQSVFAIILAVLAKIYFSVYSDIAALSIANEYLYVWILFVFTIGVLVGYLKEDYQLKYQEMKDEKNHLKNQIKDIKEVNEVNLEVKNLYEERLLNYGDSFGTIYEMASELDLVEPQGIIFKAIEVVQKIMRTDEVSIYLTSGNENFFRLIASSAKKERNLSTSLRTADYVSLFEKMQEKEIFVNTQLEPDYPMMAAGIYQNDHLQSIIMLWSLPFESNNLYQMNVFEVSTKLIESKLNVAYNYMTNLGSSYNLKYENMLDKKSFEKIIDLYELGHQKGIVDYTLLKIRKKEESSQEEFIDRIEKNIRETDYIYLEDEDSYILLANTNQENASYVIQRFKNEGLIVEEGEFIAE